MYNSGQYDILPSIWAFGDSITAGVGATTSADDYVEKLAALKGWSFTNNGDPGSQIADPTQVDVVYNLKVVGGMNIVTLAGANDMTYGKTDTNKQNTYKNSLSAVLVWAAIADNRKTKAQALTQTGTWTNLGTGTDGGIGVESTTNGSTLTGTASGTVVYIGNIVRDSAPGTFTVHIDGVSQGTFNTTESNIPVREGGVIAYACSLLRFSGLSDADHTVLITVTSATNSANKVYIDYIAGNRVRPENKANVYVGNTLELTAAGYVDKGTSAATVTAYGTLISDICDMLQGDGLNVFLVDTRSVVDPATEFFDNQHPNDQGYTNIANAFDLIIPETIDNFRPILLQVRSGSSWVNAVPQVRQGSEWVVLPSRSYRE